MRYKELMRAEEKYLTDAGWTKRRLGRAHVYHWIPPRSLDPEASMLIEQEQALEWQKRLDRETGGQ